MEMVENDLNVVKNNSELTVTEVSEESFDASLKLIAEEFAYMEIL